MPRYLLCVLAVVACKDKQPVPQPAPNPPAAEDAAPMTSTPVASTANHAMPAAADIAALVKGNNNFALELWSRFGTGNQAMSPASISTALAMAWAGASDQTAEQMKKVLHFEGSSDAIVSQWARISRALQEPSRTGELRMANRFYGDKRFTFDTTYFTITRKAFDAPLEMVDFVTAAEPQRQKINAWVAERTNQRIKDLLPQGTVTDQTKLVIVNAIYFLADWADPFDPAATTPQQFFGATPKTVPTMHRTGHHQLARGEGAAMLELPYQANSASMYILLPDKRDGLAELERGLAGKLKALQRKLHAAQVAVALPKFTIDPQAPIDLAKQLAALGMPLAFDQKKAEFTNIAKSTDPNDRISLSAVLHKAWVKVDEQGTQAAAATAIAAPTGGAPSALPEQFIADHPFLFVIVDKGTGLILFIGRVVEPIGG